MSEIASTIPVFVIALASLVITMRWVINKVFRDALRDSAIEQEQRLKIILADFLEYQQEVAEIQQGLEQREASEDLLNVEQMWALTTNAKANLLRTREQFTGEDLGTEINQLDKLLDQHWEKEAEREDEIL
jgi:hypothetical protein